MAKDKIPTTPAVRVLRQHKVAFTPHLYPYQDHGGAAWAAESLGVDNHAVIKTLVFVDSDKKPLVVIMHGDMEVSTKALARELDVKSVEPCDPADAQRHTGYQVGGISPFGQRKNLPIYMQRSIAELPVIYINGGKRGFLVEMSPDDLSRVLKPAPVDAGQN